MLAHLADFEVADDAIAAFARGLARVRSFSAELQALDLDGVRPWTPPS